MKVPELRLVAWELTRSCNLNCIHCRAAAEKGPYEGELSTDKVYEIMDGIEKIGKPIIILTGGEPLLREDIFEIAKYGDKKGFRMVMATNGTLINEENMKKMIDSGIQRISLSIDGSTPEQHDDFRKVKGAFQSVMDAIEICKKFNMPFQINTTITKININEIPAILELSVAKGAAALHIFLLVPTGRGKELAEQEIPPEEYERILNWFYDQHNKVPLQLKATCAPHYYRILRQRAKEEGKKVDFTTFGLDAVTKGCLGGKGFCFISHTGIVQPCGYLEVNCGDVNLETFDNIWKESKIFNELRYEDGYHGKCGICEYRKVCGGCRARAYEVTGNYLNEEPYCIYTPKKMEKA
jgi:heme b synthase